LKKAEEDFPCIGRLCLSLKRTQKFEDINDLWIELCDHVITDRFDIDYDEIYCALIGFSKFRRFCFEEWQLKLVDSVLLKLQNYLMIHLRSRKFNLR
jgi:hypothetical protein